MSSMPLSPTPSSSGCESSVFDLPPPSSRPIQWRRALRALRALLADPDQTEKAFEIFVAIGARDEERDFQRFCAHPEGGRLLRERPSLIDRLADRAALARLPADSFGRAYLAYLERTGFEADGLLQLKETLQERAESEGETGARLDPAREWYRDRSLLMHDLWHVLTDYGTDELGETALLPFAYAQLGGRANLLLTLGATARSTIDGGLSLPPYLLQAWRRGRQAVWLPVLRYETMLSKPLETVRREARIAFGRVAHPGGILRGTIKKLRQ
jgi:ubiquinone biosynthesis protein COQ4